MLSAKVITSDCHTPVKTSLVDPTCTKPHLSFTNPQLLSATMVSVRHGFAPKVSLYTRCYLSTDAGMHPDLHFKYKFQTANYMDLCVTRSKQHFTVYYLTRKKKLVYFTLNNHTKPIFTSFDPLQPLIIHVVAIELSTDSY